MHAHTHKPCLNIYCSNVYIMVIYCYETNQLANPLWLKNIYMYLFICPQTCHLSSDHLDSSFILCPEFVGTTQLGLEKALSRWFTHKGSKLLGGYFSPQGLLHGVTCSSSQLGFMSKHPKGQNMENGNSLRSELINWPRVTNALF